MNIFGLSKVGCPTPPPTFYSFFYASIMHLQIQFTTAPPTTDQCNIWRTSCSSVSTAVVSLDISRVLGFCLQDCKKCLSESIQVKYTPPSTPPPPGCSDLLQPGPPPPTQVLHSPSNVETGPVWLPLQTHQAGDG